MKYRYVIEEAGNLLSSLSSGFCMLILLLLLTLVFFLAAQICHRVCLAHYVRVFQYQILGRLETYIQVTDLIIFEKTEILT